jgi:hypothetical protein
VASSYPGGYDSLAKPTATTKEDDAGFEHDIVHTNEANAIEAVQATLGLNPQGAFATVDARIDDLEVLGKPVLSKVRNSTGATLTKGTVVYLSGATGNHVNVTKALATSDATSARTHGFIYSDIANNADGYVIVEGYLEGIDTSAAASDGQIVYLSGSVAGGWTVTKPVAPIHLVYLGVIAKKNPSTGAIYVKVQNGFELDEIHDVLIVSEANGDLLKYDSATGLWKNAAQSTLAVAQSQVTNLTTDLAGKVGTARTISTTAPLAGGGDLSADRTLTIADATTSVKGAVQLTDSTSSTSTTTAATPNAVKSAYDLANGAVPKSTVTTTGDLIVADGASSVARLGKGSTGQVLTAGASTISWATPAASGVATVQDEGSALTARTTVNFTGAGVVASDNAGSTRTDVAVYGAYNPATTAGSMVHPISIPATAAWTTTGQLRYARVWLETVTYSGLCFRISSVGSGSTIRAAVYNYNAGVGSPAAKITATEISHTPASTGNITVSFGSTFTPSAAGFYFLAIAIQGGTVQLESINLVDPFQVAATTAFPIDHGSAFQDFIWTTGVLKDPPFAGQASTNPANIAAIGIRKA